jgi:hypothetical protein
MLKYCWSQLIFKLSKLLNKHEWPILILALVHLFWTFLFLFERYTPLRIYRNFPKDYTSHLNIGHPFKDCCKIDISYLTKYL